MHSDFLKRAYDQGYEDTLVAFGLEKQAISIAPAAKAVWSGLKWGASKLFGKPAAGAAAPKNVMGGFGRTMDFANRMPAQLGAGFGRMKLNDAVTNATV